MVDLVTLLYHWLVKGQGLRPASAITAIVETESRVAGTVTRFCINAASDRRFLPAAVATFLAIRWLKARTPEEVERARQFFAAFRATADTGSVVGKTPAA